MESDAWKGWDLWSWYAESTSGESQEFTSHDEFGEVAEYTLSQTAKGVRNPWFIIRNGGSSWTGGTATTTITRFRNRDQHDCGKRGKRRRGILDRQRGSDRVHASGERGRNNLRHPRRQQRSSHRRSPSEALRAFPETPTRDGYVFSKWTADVAGEHEYDFATTVSAPITLYAQWTEAKTVTFDVQGGSEVAAQQVQTGNRPYDRKILSAWDTRSRDEAYQRRHFRVANTISRLR